MRQKIFKIVLIWTSNRWNNEHDEVIGEKKKDLQTVKEKKNIMNINNQSGIGIDSSQIHPEIAETGNNVFEKFELEEKQEGFIGTSLPGLMTKEEGEAM